MQEYGIKHALSGTYKTTKGLHKNTTKYTKFDFFFFFFYIIFFFLAARSACKVLYCDFCARSSPKNFAIFLTIAPPPPPSEQSTPLHPHPLCNQHV